MNFSDFSDFSDFFGLFVDYIWEKLGYLFALPFNQSTDFYWLYLCSSFVFAFLIYRLYEQKQDTFSFRSFLSFCFPKRIYTHRSAVLDYKLFVLNRFIYPLFTLLSFSCSVIAAHLVTKGLNLALGPNPLQWEWNIWTIVAFTLVFTLVSDFSFFVYHIGIHSVKPLWVFHRVHHSSEVLTLFSADREHPVLSLLLKPLRSMFMGFLYGFVYYFFLGEPEFWMVCGATAGQFPVRFFGCHLRHSHIWFSYGRILNHILISPAHHQIHHSSNPKHFGKNYGSIFAIWDWMFGTLYVPKEKEQLTFGTGPSVKPFTSAREVYLRPLKECFLLVTKSNKK